METSLELKGTGYINIAAINNDEKKILIAEVKLNPRKIDMVYLEEKHKNCFKNKKTMKLNLSDTLWRI